MRRRRRFIALLVVGMTAFGLGGGQATSSPSKDVAVTFRVSDSPDRSHSVPLEGAVLSGEQYIFVPKVTGMRSVVFYAGEPSASTKIRSEGGYPYDLAGGSKARAEPTDVTEFGSGETTLTAVVHFRNGGRQMVSANFHVEPQQPIEPEPTSSPTPDLPSPTIRPTTTPKPSPTQPPKPSPSQPPASPSEAPEPEDRPSQTPGATPPDPEPAPPSGFPSEDTTGVPAGTKLKTVNGMTVTKAGEVLDGLDIRGCLTIAADNVILRNSKVACSAGSSAVIKVAAGSSGVLIEDVEIDGLGASSNGVGSGGFTLRRANIHSSADGIRAGSNTVIEYSYIHHLSRIGDSHNDGIQSVGGSNIVIRYNNIQAYNSTTKDPMNAAYIFAPDLSQLGSIEVYGNLMNGGNYTIFGSRAKSAVFRDNVFGRDFRYGPTRIDGTVDFDNSNRWYDNGRSVQ